MAKYLSGRSKRTPQSGLTSDRYLYLDVSQAEPNLGDPVEPGPVLPVGQQYQSVSIIGYPGKRYWLPVGGGLIPGTLSIYDEGLITPPGGVSSITQLNFVGAAISAKGYLNLDGSPGVGVTITVFSPGTQGQVIFNNDNDFKGASGLFYDNSTNYVGIGTSLPTQELDLNGDLRLRGTIYDYNNQPGTNTQILIKNNFGGLTWVSQETVRAGAGGTITNIQYHNNAGLVDGAANFVFDYTNSRVGIGSTLPAYLFDVLGYSRFKGQTEIDNLRVTGVTTVGFATITNSYLGVTTIGYGNIINSNLGITTVGLITATNAYIGIGTVGFATITNSYLGVTTVGLITATTGYIGILTVGEINIDRTNLINLNVTGIATIATLGITGLTTTRNLNVIGITTTNSLNVAGLTTTRNLKVTGIATFDNQVDVNNIKVTGVGTFGNVKISGGTVATDSGNLTLDSLAGTTQINDAVYVNDTTQSTDTNTGSIYTEGGVGIDKNLNVGGQVNIAGISTFDGYIDANSGAYIDNIQIGITGDNEIDTTTGNLTIDSAGGTTTIDDNLIVSGTSTFNGNVIFGDATSDTVSFTSRISSNVLPSTDGTLNLGGTSNKWNNVYANNFNGAFIGNADTATRLLNSRNIAITGDLAWNVNFDGSANVTATGTLANSGVAANTYGSSTTVPVFAVDAKGRVTSVTNTGINFSTSTVAQADKLTNSRNIAITGDLSWNVNFDGSANVTATGTLANSGVTAGTYGSSTQVGIVTVDAKGRVTSASNIPISFSSATVDKANQLTNARNFSITGDVDATAVSFNGTGNVNLVTTLDNSGVVAATYGSSTQVPVFTVDAKGRVTSVTNTGVNFNTATVAQADKLTNSRNIAITGDLAWNVNFDGSANVTATGTLANSGVTANTYGSSSTVPVFTVDAKGRVTSVTNTGINFSTATVAQSDTIKTIATVTNASFYPTFVNSNNASAAYESVYTDAGITYNPSTDLLTVGKIKPTQIQDSGGATGTANYVLTANGSGGWSWASVTNLSNGVLTNYAETTYAYGNTGTSPNLALSNGNFVTATLTASATFTFTLTSTPAASGTFAFTLFLSNDATSGRTIVWPTSVKWPGGTIPSRTTTASRTDVYTFFTINNGTNWYGNLAQYNYA
jgi:hypothetical protein